MTRKTVYTLFHISLCGLISILLSSNAYSSQKVVANWTAPSSQQTASISFHVASTVKSIQGDLITIAISGPVNQQISCPISGKSQHCTLHHLKPGRYHVTAMGLTDSDQHYVGSAAEEPVVVSVNDHAITTITYAAKPERLTSTKTNPSVKNHTQQQ